MLAPVIYVFFNRPAVTRLSFAELRKARPGRLHLIADGPRANHPDDVALCAQTRAIVEGQIDWPCEVTRDYAATNLGCGRRVSSGLTAAFALLGEAIVLEDDIMPHPDFFPFCTALLKAHRHDAHIHSISGFQPLNRFAPSRGEMVPTTFGWIWGWASWQRAWKDYRFDIAPQWRQPAIREGIREYVGNALNFQGHGTNFDLLVQGRVDTWDFQWTFALLAQRRVALVSSVNLVRNVGFNAAATHTVDHQLYLQNLQLLPSEPTQRRRDTRIPHRFHDKLFGEVIHGRTRANIARLRLSARFPGVAQTLFGS